VHLLDGDLGQPLTPQSANTVQTGPTPPDTTTTASVEPIPAH
jgi:hypothetical protein